MATWHVTTDGNGFSVRKDRASATSFSDLDDALRHVRARFMEGDRVMMVEDDGYRTTITRQVARNSWRR